MDQTFIIEFAKEIKRLEAQLTEPLRAIGLPTVIVPKLTDWTLRSFEIVRDLPNSLAWSTVEAIFEGDPLAIEDTQIRVCSTVALGQDSELKENLPSFLWEISCKMLNSKGRPYFKNLQDFYSYVGKAVINEWVDFKRQESWWELKHMDLDEPDCRLVSKSPEELYLLKESIQERLERQGKKLLSYLLELEREDQRKVLESIFNLKEKNRIWESKNKGDVARRRLRRQLREKYETFRELTKEVKNLVEMSDLAHQYLLTWLLERLRTR